MFNNWIWVYQTLVYMEENKLAADEEFLEAMEWLQIEADIVEGKVGKVGLYCVHLYLTYP